MGVEILMSCMHQHDDALIRSSRLTGDVTVINQCDREDFREYPTPDGTARIWSVTDRGLTRSRNLALEKARGDICMLCDDDETFLPGYADTIRAAYDRNPRADILIFKMVNRPPSFPDREMDLGFPAIMKVSSWQISFRRQRLLDSGVRFDTHLGAGTGNGAEEELKFLLDALRAGLRIRYVPEAVASVAQEVSTWFTGFDEAFFVNRGATTRYIFGTVPAAAYGVYYVLRKKHLYQDNLTPAQALAAIFRGIREDKIGNQVRQERRNIQ